MRKLTEEDMELMAKAFTNESRLVPLNIGRERNPVGTIVRCYHRPGQTTATAAAFRKIAASGARSRAAETSDNFSNFDDKYYPLSDLDPEPGAVEKSVLLGLVQMDDPSTTEQVLALVQSLDLQLGTYQDMLAALHDQRDLMVGGVIMALGTSVVANDGRVYHPRHVAFWKGERTLRLEYQNEQAEGNRWHNVKAVEDRKRGALVGSMEEIPFAWPHQYRFLVRLKDFS